MLIESSHRWLLHFHGKKSWLGGATIYNSMAGVSWTASRSPPWLVCVFPDAGQSSAAESQSKSFSVLLLEELHLSSPAERKENVEEEEQNNQETIFFLVFSLTCLIFSNCSSSSRKKVRYINETSTSGLPPNFRCSSMVSFPPENACLLICVGTHQSENEQNKYFF